MARPLPVEYLLVDVPASTPLVPIYTFTARTDKDMFPVENRYLDGHLQDFNALSAYLSNWAPNEFLEVYYGLPFVIHSIFLNNIFYFQAVSDFHLLLYLSRMDMLPMKASMKSLLEAVRTKNSALADEWKQQDVWTTLETLITASSSSAG